jgi:uncharacterized membrane protein
MSKIFLTGFLTSLLIGILFFLLKFLLDALTSVFRPLIMYITSDREYLVIPLTIVFSLVVILIVGLITTRIHFQELFTRYFRRVPKNLEKARGALVKLDEETYALAIVIKEIEMKNAIGEMEQFYVLYCPGAPFPWSGLPVIYAKKEDVRLLKLSFVEIYGITGSFGENTPKTIFELKN